MNEQTHACGTSSGNDHDWSIVWAIFLISFTRITDKMSKLIADIISRISPYFSFRPLIFEKKSCIFVKFIFNNLYAKITLCQVINYITKFDAYHYRSIIMKFLEYFLELSMQIIVYINRLCYRH